MRIKMQIYSSGDYKWIDFLQDTACVKASYLQPTHLHLDFLNTNYAVLQAFCSLQCIYLAKCAIFGAKITVLGLKTYLIIYPRYIVIFCFDIFEQFHDDFRQQKFDNLSDRLGQKNTFSSMWLYHQISAVINNQKIPTTNYSISQQCHNSQQPYYKCN